MSYILDALRKAEKERNLRKVPDIMTQQDTVIHIYKKGTIWHYFLIMFLIVLSVVFWFVIKRTERISQESNINKIAGKVTSEVIDEKELKQRSENRDTLVSKNRIVSEVEYEKNDPAKDTQRSSEMETEEKNPLLLTQIDDKVRVSEQRIFNIRELPSDIQQSLPELSMSVHIYHPEPASRLVKINGRTIKEGEELSPGLRLTEIIREGAILSYHGYRFYVWLK